MFFHQGLFQGQALNIAVILDPWAVEILRQIAACMLLTANMIFVHAPG